MCVLTKSGLQVHSVFLGGSIASLQEAAGHSHVWLWKVLVLYMFMCLTLLTNVWSVLAAVVHLSLLLESSCVCLQCCGPARACSLKGFDSEGNQVFYFERPLRMDACCLGCCLMEMRAFTPQKHLIGTVHQR